MRFTDRGLILLLERFKEWSKQPRTVRDEDDYQAVRLFINRLVITRRRDRHETKSN